MGLQLVKILGDPITIKPTLRGAYDGATAYTTGDMVSYNGSSYIANQNTTGNLPTVTTYWQLAATKGDTGATGATGPTGPTGPTGAGVPTGGTTDQVLKKASNTDYDFTWGSAAAAIDDLTDVAITTPASGQAIVYNGSSWVNGQGGKTYYKYVVAASGGDYTKLSSALAAMSDGDSVFVAAGTYTETGAITCALNNITIVGATPAQTRIVHSTYNYTFSGTDVKIFNLKFTSTTATRTFSGSGFLAQNCHFEFTDTPASGAGNNVFSGTYSQILGCRFLDGRSSATVAATALNGSGSQFNDNYCECVMVSGKNWLSISGTYAVVSGNNFRVASGTYNASNYLISNAADHCTISGNMFNDVASSAVGRAVMFTGQAVAVTGNTFKGVRLAVYGSAFYHSIVGNMIVTSNSAAIGIATNGGASVVSGNSIYHLSGTGTTVGIQLNSSSGSTVTGNLLGNCATGISLSSGLTNTSVTGNTFYACTTAITNASTSAVVSNNAGANMTTETAYKVMKNTSGGTINAGNVVVFKSVANGDEVTTTTTAGDNKVFGVATAAITTNTYGEIQTLGKTTLLTVDGTTDIAIGDYLTCFTTAGIAAKAAAGNMVFAIALEAYTANDSSGVLDALLITPRLI